jgi:hypothetical protein
MVEAAAMNPNNASGAFRELAKGFRTGFLDIVELKSAKNPTKQRTQKR